MSRSFWVAFTALLLAFSNPSARATTFANLSVEQMTDASSRIVQGRVQEVWTEVDTDGEVVWTVARVAIDDVLKGSTDNHEVVVSSMGGSFGDLSLHIEGQALFSTDEEVLLFLTKIGDRVVPVSKFLGKYTLRRANGDTKKHAMVWHPHKGRTFDARFLPHPKPSQRVYADDLRAQIAARVAAGWDGRDIPGADRTQLEAINHVNRGTTK